MFLQDGSAMARMIVEIIQTNEDAVSFVFVFIPVLVETMLELSKLVMCVCVFSVTNWRI